MTFAIAVTFPQSLAALAPQRVAGAREPGRARAAHQLHSHLGGAARAEAWRVFEPLLAEVAAEGVATWAGICHAARWRIEGDGAAGGHGR